MSPKKYFTLEEKRAAKKETAKRYYDNNRDAIRARDHQDYAEMK